MRVPEGQFNFKIPIDYLLTKWHEYVHEKEKDLREKIAFSVFKKFYESRYGIHSLDSFYKAPEEQSSIDFLGEIAGRKIGLEITEYFDESFMDEERNAIADLVSANLNSKRFISDWFKFSDRLRRSLLEMKMPEISGIFYFKEANLEALKLEQNSLQQILFTDEVFFEIVLNEITKHYAEIKAKGHLNIVLEKYSKILIRILCKYEEPIVAENTELGLTLDAHTGRVAERTSSRLRRTNDRSVRVISSDAEHATLMSYASKRKYKLDLSSLHEDHEDNENAEIGVPLHAHTKLFWHSKFITTNDFYRREIIVDIIRHKAQKKYRGEFDDKWLLIYCWSRTLNSFMRQDRIIEDWESISAELGESGFSKIYFLSPFYYGLDAAA